FSYSSRHLPALHSFPTRRSSDLILGMSRREIDHRYGAIVDFSGLDPAFMETPVNHYSSGMYARLAFAVAVHVDPDVLLVDEVLSDRKSTRLNSSHLVISYAVFCL